MTDGGGSALRRVVSREPPDPPPHPPVTAATPRRVLVVSADIGGGHDATGRALQERILELWPGSTVRWLDTLDVMGPGVGAAFRRVYVTNVELTPWLYEFFFRSLWRYPWLARASKAFTGAWAGRRLGPRIEAFDPDLVISTYPLGSAGLAWLRRHRGLGVPIGAWVSDFAPHPFWVYPQLDLNLVVHPQAVPLADAAAPGAPIAVCPPPVLKRFHPGDRAAARELFGLDTSRYVVVVACGSFGFGAVEEAVRGLATLAGPVQVVVVCGHNRQLADRLTRLGTPADRLRVLGWVDDMPALLRAADLLVTNAGGATALEAWATGTPMLMYRPIAAHGAANAALMTACGLTDTSHDLPDLLRRVRLAAARGASPRPYLNDGDACLAEFGLLALAASTPAPPPVPAPPAPSPTSVPALPKPISAVPASMPSVPASVSSVPASVSSAPATVSSVPASVPAVLTAPATGAHPESRPGATDPRRRRPRRAPSWPLRAQDAFFLHVQSPTVAQQIGAVLELGPLPDGRPVERDEIVDLLARRLPAITTLRRRLSGRGRWRRPGWVVDPWVDPADHVDEHHLPSGSAESAADSAIDLFWSQPLPMHRPLWQVLLVTGLAGGRTRLAVKVHHSLGDGLSVIGTVQRLFDPPPEPNGHGKPPGPARRPAVRPRGKALAEAARSGTRRTLGTMRGLARLAVAGRAPRTPVNRPLRTPGRVFVSTTLPSDELRRVARRSGAHISELMCALVAEALGNIYLPPAATSGLRAMFAVSLDPRDRSRTHGNWTGAIALDLPVEPLPPLRRLAEVRDRLRSSVTSGQPLAAILVMRAMGVLPAPIHGALARRVYNHRFLNVIVSYLSQRSPHPHRLAGAPVRAVTPVVALADGVPIGVGVLRWGDTTNVGILLDETLAHTAGPFVAALHAAFTEMSRSSPSDLEPDAEG
ncbi:wax ester/triacylglycerol synthase domain-containing protein [Plantactinospora sp. B6F1]|uniref:wax ester/triacylglycerol synthase domain-containing protein n=1 Tax=Plantactinospora sp. B6F1 TaxID=3158971 RepID=UPI0032D9338A